MVFGVFIVANGLTSNLKASDVRIVENENLNSNSHKLTKLEKEEETISTLAEYKKKLYINQIETELAKKEETISTLAEYNN